MPTVDELFRMDREGKIPKARVVVKDLIHEGVTFLSGPSKSGKSSLVMTVCEAVAAGDPLFGRFKTTWS